MWFNVADMLLQWVIICQHDIEVKMSAIDRYNIIILGLYLRETNTQNKHTTMNMKHLSYHILEAMVEIHFVFYYHT